MMAKLFPFERKQFSSRSFPGGRRRAVKSLSLHGADGSSIASLVLR